MTVSTAGTAAVRTAALREAVKKKWPDHFCVIRMESNYGAAKLRLETDENLSPE